MSCGAASRSKRSRRRGLWGASGWGAVTATCCLLDLLAALLAGAHLGAVLQEAVPHPRRPVALGAYQRQVGQVHGRLLLHDPGLPRPLLPGLVVALDLATPLD